MLKYVALSIVVAGCMVGGDAPPSPPVAISVHDVAAGPFQFHDPIAAGPADWADPSLLFANGIVYRYSTENGLHVPVTSSASLTDGWAPPHDALPSLPAWALGSVWAPDVVELGGVYWMYYAASIDFVGTHAIGAAWSTSPDGPFTPAGDSPLVVDPYGRGVIDPEFALVNGDGWLVWSTDWGPGGRGSGVTRTIVAQHLADAAHLDGPIELLVQADQDWELGTTEAPAIIVDQYGIANLTYNGGNYEDASYTIGVARCDNFPYQPCAKYGPMSIPGGGGSQGGLDVVPAPWGWIGIFHHGAIGDREDDFVALTAN